MTKFVVRLMAALCIALTLAPLAQAGVIAPPGVAAANSIPGYFNLAASSLPKWRLAVAKMQAGTYRPRVLIVGDSLSIGTGAGTGGSVNLNNAYAASWPVAMANILSSVGIPAQIDSFIGARVNGAQVTPAALDPRLTLGTGWVLTGGNSIGGNFFQTSTTAGSLSFTPASQFDTATIYYLVFPAQGSFTVNVDGGSSLATVSEAGTAAITSTTVTTTLGTHTLNIQASAATTIDVIGVETYNSASKKVSVVDAAFGGSGATGANNWSDTSQPFNPIFGIGAFAPDLCIIALGANDKNTSATAAAYQTGMQSVITKCQLSGDVILVQQTWANPASGFGNTTLDPQYKASLVTLSNSNGVPLVDLEQRYVSWTLESSLGYTFDNVHLNNYQDMASAIAKAVLFPLR